MKKRSIAVTQEDRAHADWNRNLRLTRKGEPAFLSSPVWWAKRRIRARRSQARCSRRLSRRERCARLCG